MVRDDLTLEELKALPSDSVVLDRDDDAWQSFDGYWYAYSQEPVTSEELLEWEPIALIWEGEDG